MGPEEKDEGHRQEAPKGQGCTNPLWSSETDHPPPHPRVSEAGPLSECGGSVRVGPTRASGDAGIDPSLTCSSSLFFFF